MEKQGCQGKRYYPGKRGCPGKQFCPGKRGYPGKRGCLGNEGVWVNEGVQGNEVVRGNKGVRGNKVGRGNEIVWGNEGVRGNEVVRGNISARDTGTAIILVLPFTTAPNLSLFFGAIPSSFQFSVFSLSFLPLQRYEVNFVSPSSQVHLANWLHLTTLQKQR